MMMVSITLHGFSDEWAYFVFGYSSILLAFMIFYATTFRPQTHPTIATFIRATLGLGVVLFPLYIPALIIGSARCKVLLDE